MVSVKPDTFKPSRPGRGSGSTFVVGRAALLNASPVRRRFA